MIACFRYIRQIREPFKLQHLLCKVFVHVPHIDNEAELIRMWFRNNTDGAHHWWALASREAGEGTRFHHLFNGVIHKFLVFELGGRDRGLISCRSSSLPQQLVAVVKPIHHNSTLDECAPKGGTLRDGAQGQWLRARRFKRDIVFSIDIITCKHYYCFRGSEDSSYSSQGARRSPGNAVFGHYVVAFPHWNIAFSIGICAFG